MKYGAHVMLPVWDDDGRAKAHGKDRLRRMVGLQVVEALEASKTPLVARLTWHEPPVMNARDLWCRVVLVAELEPVQTMRVVVPEPPDFDFISRPKREVQIEWQCDYCGMVNPIEARYCGENFDHAGGCGHPRGFIYTDRYKSGG